MPKLKDNQVPSYRRHKQSGQAIVTLSGRDHLLGAYGSTESRQKYDRLIGEWLANGRRADYRNIQGLTISRVIAEFWAHAKSYYATPEGGLAGEAENFRQILGLLRRLYGALMATEFGPLRLKALQLEMIRLNWCRTHINRQTARIRQVFKWAVAQELVPPPVYHGLLAVAGLRKGKSEVRESEPVKPVEESHVEAILPFVSPQVKAMIQLQMLTGMRSTEVCIMRGCDIDTTAAPWVYRPAFHKTEHHGHVREVWIGPKAQEIVKPFLKPDLKAYLFSPQDAEAHRHGQAKHHRREGQKPNPKGTERTLGERYDRTSYARAIARGCDDAFPLPDHLACLRVPAAGRKHKSFRWETVGEWKTRLGTEKWEELCQWRSQHRWHPHQLRHNAATRLRRDYGLEAARIILGHKTAAITEVYAEQDRTKARQIMADVG